MSLSGTATRVVVVVLAAGLALAVATSALGGSRSSTAVDRLLVTTHPVAVPAAVIAKPKAKAPLCMKGQKSTKTKPCRKRRPAVVRSVANPPVAGWTFGMTITQYADGTWGLGLTYADKAGNTTETHSFLFKLSGDSVVVAPDLSTLTINTGTQMGQFGAVSLTLSNVTALAQGARPAYCTTGTWQTRSGTLTGTLRFVADGTYFKSLAETSLAADLSANTSGAPATCGNLPPTCVHESLIYGGDPNTGSGLYEAYTEGGKTTVLAILSQAIAPAQVTHYLITTGLPGSDLTVAADLSTATLATDGAAPSFTGSLSFARTGAATTFSNATCGGTTASFVPGTTTGSGIVAHFLAITALTLPLGNSQVDVF